MIGDWQRMGSRAWWIMATAFFLGLELLLRIKLGSIWIMIIFCTFVWQLLAVRLGDPLPMAGWGQRLMYAIFAGYVIGAVIFAVFAVPDIVLRSINNDWRWFQLP